MWILGLRIENPRLLPQQGPAIVVANHNSHLDTAALLAAFPTEALDRVRPAAAADYFLRNRVMAWLSTRVIGVLPVERHGGADPLAACRRALSRGDIVLLFPEGTRGEPGRMERFRGGVAQLARTNPGAPVIPIHIAGTERAMPRGVHFPRCRGIRLTVGSPEQLQDPDPATAVARIQHRVEALGRLS
jgi:1-acyl-sn-glycerol-3-phosphate acyltransferase